jgi:hypothetical protein
VPARDPEIFRKAALERLASPERLDERLELPALSRTLAALAFAAVAAAAAFAAWLLLRP